MPHTFVIALASCGNRCVPAVDYTLPLRYRCHVLVVDLCHDWISWDANDSIANITAAQTTAEQTLQVIAVSWPEASRLYAEPHNYIRHLPSSSGQVWGHTPGQRVAASTLRRYSFDTHRPGRRQARHANILQIGLRLAIAQADARPVMPKSFR